MNKVKLYGASLSYKFLKNQIIDDRFLLGGDGLFVTACKNEYESVQIVLAAKEDFMYSVSVFDLVSDSGKVISKDCVELFQEKFVKIDRMSDFKGNGLGYYPDATIPFSAVVAANENKVLAGDNCVILAQIKILEDTVCGVYKGEIKLSLPEEISIPITVKVLDITIPKHTTQKSIAIIRGDMVGKFEEDESEEAYQRYVDFLIDHRLNPDMAAKHFTLTYDGMREYCKSLKKLVEKGVCFSGIQSVQEFNGSRYQFSRESLVECMVAIADESLECGVNLAKYFGFYNWCCDEPFAIQDNDGIVQGEVEAYAECVRKAVERLETCGRFNGEFGREIVESIKNIKQLFTDYYDFKMHAPNYTQHDRDGKPWKYDLATTRLCPKFDAFDSPKRREQYKGSEPFWYNCGEPNAPYCTYHIDESGIGQRLVGWMMADYDISGLLFWAVNNFTEIDEKDFSSRVTDDPFRIVKGLGLNNEGTLIYPGKTYGLSSPIDSLRFIGIRDGQEDYEILMMVKKGYLDKGKNFDGIYRVVTSLLYDNAKFDYFNDTFDAARDNLLTLADMCINHGVTMEVVDLGDSYRFSVFGADSVSVDGKNVGEDFTVNKQSRNADFVVTVSGKQFNLSLYLGKGLVIIMPHELDKHVEITGAIFTIGDVIHECVWHKEITLSSVGRKFKLEFKYGLEDVYKLGISFVAKKDVKYKITTDNGKKLITEGNLKTLDETYGSASRVDFDGREVVNGVLEITLEDYEKIGFREIYLYR